MTTATFDELQEQAWEEAHETEVLALSGVVAAAVITVGGMALLAVAFLLPAMLIGG